ncbi:MULTISPECIES: Ms4533A family Cys-rich leader peptide [Streptomyces]|nr:MULTISPECIES: Ms4533A family Cys-rich leader peptide [Streptomyces]
MPHPATAYERAAFELALIGVSAQSVADIRCR